MRTIARHAAACRRRDWTSLTATHFARGPSGSVHVQVEIQALVLIAWMRERLFLEPVHHAGRDVVGDLFAVFAAHTGGLDRTIGGNRDRRNQVEMAGARAQRLPRLNAVS